MSPCSRGRKGGRIRARPTRDLSRSHDARVKENLTASMSALLDYFFAISAELGLSEIDRYGLILALGSSDLDTFVRIPRGADEGSKFFRTLAAGRLLHAAGDIDAPRLELTNRLTDILRTQTAGNDQF